MLSELAGALEPGSLEPVVSGVRRAFVPCVLVDVGVRFAVTLCGHCFVLVVMVPWYGGVEMD